MPAYADYVPSDSDEPASQEVAKKPEEVVKQQQRIIEIPKLVERIFGTEEPREKELESEQTEQDSKKKNKKKKNK